MKGVSYMARGFEERMCELVNGINLTNLEVFIDLIERAANAPAEFQDQWFDIADAALHNGFE